MNLSYWEYQSFFKDIDVLVVGSGIVGLNAAITIQEKHPSKKVIIAERGTLPTGASTKNAGFSCFGSVSELIDDLKGQSEDLVWSVLEKRWLGLQRLKQRIGTESMDYFQHGNFEVFGEQDQALYQACQAHIAPFNRQIEAITGVKNTFATAHEKIKDFGLAHSQQLIWNQSEGQINTGKMMQQLLKLAREKGIEIYNGLSIVAIEETAHCVQVKTTQGWSFQSQQVIVATNGFAQQLLPNLAIKPARNQVLITEPIKGLKLKGCFHYLRGYVYFRDIDNRVLLGGARHLDKAGETTDQFGFSEKIQDYLIDILKHIIVPYQKVEISRWWSGILGVGTAKNPIIERVSDRLVVAARMGGMGIAIGSLVGEEGAALLD